MNPPAAAAEEPLDAEGHKQRGNELFRAKQWAEAAAAYEAAQRAGPTAAAAANLAAARLKLQEHEAAAAAADEGLGLAATAAVRAKLHYRRGLALRGLGRSGAREAFTAASRCSFMKEVASEALAHEVGGGECDLTAVPCVRKLADAYFDRIARVGNTAASSVCRSQDSHNCTDEIFAAARGGDSSATLDVLFAGVGDIRNALATLVDLHSSCGTMTVRDDDGPDEVRRRYLDGPTWGVRVSIHMNDLSIATLARNVVLLAVAATGPAADAAPAEQLEWTYYMLAVWGNRTLFPVHAERLAALLERLVAASGDIASFHSAFGHLIRLDGCPNDSSVTLEQLRVVWRGWLTDPRSAELTPAEIMEAESRRASAAQMRRTMQMLGQTNEVSDRLEEELQHEQDFFETTGYLILSKDASAVLAETEAGRAALASYNTQGAIDGKVMNPTLCCQDTGEFLDAQGPFKAYEHGSEGIEDMLLGSEPWGVPAAYDEFVATCPPGLGPGDTFPFRVEGRGELDVEVPENTAPGESFEFEIQRQTTVQDRILLRLTHGRRIFQAATTDKHDDGMNVTVHVAPGDAFEAAAGYARMGQRFDIVNTSNISDYSGALACLLWFTPLLKTKASLLQTQTMLGTHSTPEQWIERQTGGALTSDELDRLLGLQSQVIRTSGTLEIEYTKVAPCLALWKAKALPAVREKLLALFAWISAEDGQHKPMGQMFQGLAAGRCLGSTCTGTFVQLIHTLCAESEPKRSKAALSGVLDALIGNDGKDVVRTSPVARRCAALMACAAHVLKRHDYSCLEPAIDPTFFRYLDPVITVRWVLTPFQNDVSNFIVAGDKEPMVLAVLTKGSKLGGKAVVKLQGAPLVAAITKGDADQVQLVDTLFLDQFTRVVTLALPRSFLVASEGWQAQLLDTIDWRWISNPKPLCDTLFEGKEAMLGDAADAAAQDDASERCEVCRCSGREATTKAEKRGPEVAQHFVGGFREGYCCMCYDKLVEDIAKKKAAQAEREKAEQAAEQMPKEPEQEAKAPTCEGIGIWGMEFTAEVVVLDDSFVKIPTPALLGVPLMAKRLPSDKKKLSQLYLITRMMSDPKTGIAPPEWQYGNGRPAPKVLLARSDLKPFTVDAWSALDDYMCQTFECFAGEDAAIAEQLSPEMFGDWLHDYHISVDRTFVDLAFPRRSRCEIQGVQSEPALNGMKGVVTGHKANGRVKVKVGERDVALKPANLRLESIAPEPEPEPEAE